MSIDNGEKTLCFDSGYGVAHPLIAPHKIRFKRSVGAASGTDHFIFAEARAASGSVAERFATSRLKIFTSQERRELNTKRNSILV